MAASRMIAGTGIFVIGTGAVLIWMGIKDYSLQTVINAAIKGEPLVAELPGDNVGMIRSLVGSKDTLNSPNVDRLSDDSVSGVIRSIDGQVGAIRSIPVFEESHINWSGGSF